MKETKQIDRLLLLLLPSLLLLLPSLLFFHVLTTSAARPRTRRSPLPALLL